MSNKLALLYLEDFTKQVDNGCPVDVLYMDFSKAFDRVPHQRLLCKINAHGIDGQILTWIENWLEGRKQRVILNGFQSDWKDVSSSVVQGSVMGPMCFIIYINDLEENIDSTVSKFADDTKLYNDVSTPMGILQIQHDIDKLSNWSESWQMEFNMDKCSVMHIGRNNPNAEYILKGNVINNTVKEKDLGVWIHNSLKPDVHCAVAVKKANQLLGLIWRNIEYKEKNIIIRLFKSLVRPHLDYCIQAWRPHLKKDINKIEKVQHRATKMIWGLTDLTHDQRLKQCNLMTMEDRGRRADLIEVFKII